ncbi:hypothetical protein N7492_003472 [Penicillium capsulatum]|uniref:Myb-like domain-containing protein n=1 Tax=Penicillium capsulatum TaxID=69766 RepID=A0A9W9LXG3_9EURO|nr:hypothetical protein N7492_003472 [Penicillium capsulatum]KAJ6121945.1 hypothetical protein N7512_004410 [Penicillium capsulatum]
MKSFSSSAINKSGKKFAPKAPVRRGAPAAAPARRPSAVQQSQTQAAQASQPERNATNATENSTSSSVKPAQPAQPLVSDDVQVLTAAPQQTTSTLPKQAATAIPTPISRPQHKPSTSVPPPPESTTSTSTTTVATDIPTSHHTSTVEPQIIPSIEPDIEQSEQNRQKSVEAQTQEPASENGHSQVHTPPSQPIASTPITRPIKWAKKTSEISKPLQAPPITAPPASQAVVPTTETISGMPARSAVPSSAAPSTPEPSQVNVKEKKRKSSKSGAETDQNGKPKRRRRRREPTPEGAELVEILPNVVKMSELCKDLKTGKKSKRETELRKLEIAEEERKHKAQEEGSNAATPVKQPSESNGIKEDRLPDPKPQNGPVMRIVNGEIVLDATSLEVDRHADAARTGGDLEDVVENQLTRKINQATYGKRTKTESWDDEMTDLFYRGLRMFGTDFMVISKLFPGRSRRQIKLKFNNEERRDPQRIKDTLWGPRESIDIATYSEMTNTTYDDPKAVQQELDEEKKLIEEQHAKEKQLQEEMMRNPTGDDNTDGKNPSGDKGNGAPVKGKSRNSKKQSKNVGGGTEEVLGSIDDFPTGV